MLAILFSDLRCQLSPNPKCIFLGVYSARFARLERCRFCILKNLCKKKMDTGCKEVRLAVAPVCFEDSHGRDMRPVVVCCTHAYTCRAHDRPCDSVIAALLQLMLVGKFHGQKPACHGGV